MLLLLGLLHLRYPERLFDNHISLPRKDKACSYTIQDRARFNMLVRFLVAHRHSSRVLRFTVFLTPYPVAVTKKQKVESVEGKPYVATSLAEKQEVKKVTIKKKQNVESVDGKPYVATSLAEKQEVKTAKKPHSRNKNEEVAKPKAKNEEVAKPEDKNEEVAKPEDKNEASSDLCGFVEWKTV
ncbi:hypothetical protein L195_g011228 [Trifolium pratense]|uniref:Uncharacterized protein n=1 Tax=Trifolium pratense TaxID=57577 RepID=A0A2K3PH27_TRIPR|nr:hypothetical protein L195_g011228 [Trifolium pratense]